MADSRIGLPITQLDTPCLLVDLDRLEANIHRMAAHAQSRGVGLRPHIKTHKIPAIAHMQVAAGAIGITTAKVSEAEVMAAAGVRDIFVAYPIVTALKARRVAALIRSGVRMIVGVESEVGARTLAAAAQEARVTIEVRVEVNTGLNRCGVAPAATAELARLVRALPGLDLDGIFTFRGGVFPGSGTRSIPDVGREEGEMMVALAVQLRAAGIPVRSVSVGSTPTAPYCAVPGVTEIRPGTYVFNDNMQIASETAGPEQVALSILATVVSRQAPDLATLDAGAKVFSGDVIPAAAGLNGYGRGFGGLDAVVERMNEEHGVARLGAGLNPKVGETMRLVPNHVCTSVNLSDELIGIRDDRVETVWVVAARGKRE